MTTTFRSRRHLHPASCKLHTFTARTRIAESKPRSQPLRPLQSNRRALRLLPRWKSGRRSRKRSATGRNPVPAKKPLPLHPRKAHPRRHLPLRRPSSAPRPDRATTTAIRKIWWKPEEPWSRNCWKNPLHRSPRSPTWCITTRKRRRLPSWNNPRAPFRLLRRLWLPRNTNPAKRRRRARRHTGTSQLFTSKRNQQASLLRRLRRLRSVLRPVLRPLSRSNRRNFRRLGLLARCCRLC